MGIVGTVPGDQSFCTASCVIGVAIFEYAMEEITTAGIDFAKSVLSLPAVDGAGRVTLHSRERQRALR
jgi:hypothetical protein